MKLIAVVSVTAALLLTAACSGGSAQPAASKTPGSATPEPSGTSLEATPTQTPTPGPTIVAATATATSEPVTATPTDIPLPTDTPTPVPPTDTPVPPTATPVPPTATSPPPPPPTPTPPPAHGPASVSLTAQNLQFAPATLYAGAGTVTITLSNLDNIVPHNVSVDGLGTSATCQGPCTVVLSVAAGPGSYPFHCTVHPYMTGTLIVQ